MASKCVILKDDYPGFPLDAFCVPKHYEEDLERILIPYGTIKDRVDRIAADIFDEFAGQPLAILVVLKGAVKFFGDLMEALNRLNASRGNSVPLDYNFVRLKSYAGDSSTGHVAMLGMDVLENVRGKNVLVVEDIIDTGLTMEHLLAKLREVEPATIRVASMLVKRRPGSSGFRPHYIGFEIPNLFVVGYALDYNENFRDLHHIAVINDHGRNKYKQPAPSMI